MFQLVDVAEHRGKENRWEAFRELRHERAPVPMVDEMILTK